MERGGGSGIGRKIALGALALVGLLGIALAVLVLSFDADRYAPQIAAAAERATGRRVTFGGPLRLRVVPRLALSVEALSLANAPGAARPEMLRVGRFDAAVGLLSLLRGTPEVHRVVLEDVDLSLEVDADGKPNWRFEPAAGAAPPAEASPDGAPGSSPAPASGPPLVPLVREIVLRDATLSWQDARSGTSHLAVVEHARIETSGPGAPTSLAVTARIDEIPLEAAGTLGPLSAWLRDEEAPWPVSLTATLAASLELAVEGTIAAPRELRGLALQLRAKADDLQAFARASGIGAGLPGPLTLSFRMSDPSPQRYAIEDLSFASAAGELAGSATVTLGGSRPEVEAELTSRRLEPSKWSGAAATGAAAAGAEAPPQGVAPGTGAASAPQRDDGRRIPVTALPWESLTRADLRLSLRAGELVLGAAALRDAELALALAGGVLTLKPLRAEVAGGKLAFEAGLTAPTRGVELRGSLQGVDLGALLRETKRTELVRRAPTDLRFDLTGRGETVREVASSLSGQIVAITHDAAIDSRALDLLGSAGSAWKPLFGQNVTELKCAVERFDLRAGVARAVVIHADAGPVVLAGEGTLDLGRESLALVLRPHAADEKYASVAVPISIDGSFARPRFTPDAVATALGAAERFGGKTLRREAGAVASLLGVDAGGGALTCAQAEAIARGKAAPPGPTSGSPAGSGGSGAAPAAREATRALERGLDKLFGR